MYKQVIRTVDFAVKHSIGIPISRKKKVVVDKCLDLKKIQGKVKELCSYIMEKHSNGRFEDLKKSQMKFGYVIAANFRFQMYPVLLGSTKCYKVFYGTST
jgi:hypothetical protein